MKIRIESEYSDSDNSNIKSRLKQNIKFWSEALKANKAIINILKEEINTRFVLC